MMARSQESRCRCDESGVRPVWRLHPCRAGCRREELSVGCELVLCGRRSIGKGMRCNVGLWLLLSGSAISLPLIANVVTA